MKVFLLSHFAFCCVQVLGLQDVFVCLLGEIKTSLMAGNLHVLYELILVNSFCYVIGSLGGTAKASGENFQEKAILICIQKLLEVTKF